jgi:hypothetical protein|tara:strand:+ start:105 stop:701 length:597 start_codon:yes stop_codon:yes gene_type:complete
MAAGPLVAHAKARLVAIAKERLGNEAFVADHWNNQGGLRSKWILQSPSSVYTSESAGETKDDPITTTTVAPAFPDPELYFDTWPGHVLKGENPLFRVANGNSMKWSGVLSYLVGGAVAKNNKRVNAKKIQGNHDGEGTILGAILVLSSTGEVLFHHQEKNWGDHPSDKKLHEAISKLEVSQEVAQVAHVNHEGTSASL